MVCKHFLIPVGYLHPYEPVPAFYTASNLVFQKNVDSR